MRTGDCVVPLHVNVSSCSVNHLQAWNHLKAWFSSPLDVIYSSTRNIHPNVCLAGISTIPNQIKHMTFQNLLLNQNFRFIEQHQKNFMHIRHFRLKYFKTCLAFLAYSNYKKDHISDKYFVIFIGQEKTCTSVFLRACLCKNHSLSCIWHRLSVLEWRVGSANSQHAPGLSVSADFLLLLLSCNVLILKVMETK